MYTPKTNDSSCIPQNAAATCSCSKLNEAISSLNALSIDNALSRCGINNSSLFWRIIVYLGFNLSGPAITPTCNTKLENWQAQAIKLNWLWLGEAKRCWIHPWRKQGPVILMDVAASIAMSMDRANSPGMLQTTLSMGSMISVLLEVHSMDWIPWGLWPGLRKA